jgi:hypothetical protein
LLLHNRAAQQQGWLNQLHLVALHLRSRAHQWLGWVQYSTSRQQWRQ